MHEEENCRYSMYESSLHHSTAHSYKNMKLDFTVLRDNQRYSASIKPACSERETTYNDNPPPLRSETLLKTTPYLDTKTRPGYPPEISMRDFKM
jgi:hypothetical protein